jgi:hypothetical protein
MPSRAEILAGLSGIAADHWPVAVLWHLAVAAALVATAVGWRPTRRRASLMLVVPLLSVATFALVAGNFFNGVVFLTLSAALFVVGRRLDPRLQVGAPGRWPVVAAAAMLTVAWAYPEFLPIEAPLAPLYATPMGLLPCPTLALVVGASLWWRGLDSRPWMTVVAVAAAFYGVFGAFVLGVRIDLILLGGAVGLVLVAFTPRLRPLPAATAASDG